MTYLCPCEGGYCTDPSCDWPDTATYSLTERENEQVSDLNDAISRLAGALDRCDRGEAAKIAREVEVEAFALRAMLRGGRV